MAIVPDNLAEIGREKCNRQKSKLKTKNKQKQKEKRFY